MKNLMMIAMVSLALIACKKEESATRTNNEIGTPCPPALIGDIECKYINPNNIKYNILPTSQELRIEVVSDNTTWSQLVNPKLDGYGNEFLDSSQFVNFDTHRILCIYDNKMKDNARYVYTPRIESVVGNETNITVTVQPVHLFGPVIGPTVAPPPVYFVLKIPASCQSVVLNTLPIIEENAPPID